MPPTREPAGALLLKSCGTQIGAEINPISGAGNDANAAARRSAMVEAAARERGRAVHIACTTRSGHARELSDAAIAAGAESVIVWGGDGTFNETAGYDEPFGLTGGF